MKQMLGIIMGFIGLIASGVGLLSWVWGFVFGDDEMKITSLISVGVVVVSIAVMMLTIVW